MLYQLSYASGPLNSRKEEQDQDRQRAWACQDAPSWGHGPRPPAKRQPSGVNRSSLSGCLFPREQEVTGKNPTALPASLTGRIWFFCRTNFEPLLINETPTESRLLSPLSRSAPSQRPFDCWCEPHSAAQAAAEYSVRSLHPGGPQATGCAWRCETHIRPPEEVGPFALARPHSRDWLN